MEDCLRQADVLQETAENGGGKPVLRAVKACMNIAVSAAIQEVNPFIASARNHKMVNEWQHKYALLLPH